MPKHQSEMKKRFGAMAYVETVDETPEDGENLLSFDTLRAAFSELDVTERDLEQDTGQSWLKENIKGCLPAIDEGFGIEALDQSHVDQDDYDAVDEDEQPEYDEDFGPVPRESISDELPRKTVESPWKFGASSISEDIVGEGGDGIEPNPQTIVEAVLFVGDRDNKPISAERIAEKMRNVEPEEIDQAVEALNQRYLNSGCPYTIRKEDNGYRMVLSSTFESIQSRFRGKIREATLSQQAIDTLAVVAYRQPISADEVQEIRKQPSSALLTQLVRRGLLEVEREIRGKKKILLYKTAERFLELFQLESIDDLPISEDIDFR